MYWVRICSGGCRRGAAAGAAAPSAVRFFGHRFLGIRVGRGLALSPARYNAAPIGGRQRCRVQPDRPGRGRGADPRRPRSRRRWSRPARSPARPPHVGRRAHRRPRGAPADQAARSGGTRSSRPSASVKNPGMMSSTPATSTSAPCAIGPTGSSPASTLARSRSSARMPLPAHHRRPEDRGQHQTPSVGSSPISAADLDEERDLHDRQPEEDQEEPHFHAAPPSRHAPRWTWRDPALT